MDAEAPIAQYTFRRSVLESGQTYELYPDRIDVTGYNVPTRTHPLADVRMVHLKYEHTKQREYYQCFIHTGRGRLSLRHVSWSGFGAFEDRRKTYTPFVRAVLAELAKRPNVRYRAGSMANFVGAVVGAPGMAALTWLCVKLGHMGTAIFAGFMGGLCMLMIGPSRPRQFDPLAPPVDLLPE